MWTPGVRSAAAVAALAVGATAAQAIDVTLGGDARSFAMGGAGIATAAAAEGSGGLRNNPASLAFDRGLFRLHWPNVGLRAAGALRLDRAFRYLLDKGSSSEASSIARRFGTEDSSIGLNGSFGVRFGHVEVLATSVGIARLQPNAVLSQWARSGSGSIPNDAQADVLGAGILVLPSVGWAMAVPGLKEDRPFDISFGGRLKFMQASYTHYIARGAGLGDNGSAFLAPEMNGEDLRTKNGVGADFGVMLRQRDNGPFTAGLVLSNFLKPSSFKFEGTDRNGATHVYDILPRTANAGASFIHGGTTLVADLVDLTEDAGKRQFRAGAEQRMGAFALRGGYSSSGGFTYGVGLFGFDIAFGERQPLEVVRTLRF